MKQNKEDIGNVNFEDDKMQIPPNLISSGMSYYQPTIMSSEKSDLYDKIRPEDVIEIIKYLLMGYTFNYQKQIWEKNEKLKDVSLTEVGAFQIATILFPVSNKSVSISKLKDNEIRERTKHLVRAIMKKNLVEWRSYGIKTAATFGFIKEIVLSIAFITLKQPEDAGVRGFIQGITQESRIIQEPLKKERSFNLFRK